MKTKLRHLVALGISLISLTSAQGQSFLTNGLVAFYKFNGDVLNSTTNGYHGTNINVSFAANRFGVASAAGQFGASNGQVNLPTGLGRRLSGTGDLAVSVWVKVGPEVNQGDKVIVAVGTYSADRLFGVGTLSGALAYSQWGSSYNLTTGFAVGDNAWHHYVVTLKSQYLTVYVDGTLRNGRLVASDRAEFFPIIGNSLGDATGQNWPGLIDDLRIYERGLSASEVASLYVLEKEPVTGIRRAVYFDAENLSVGTTYQAQITTDATGWTNLGSPFVATNSFWRSTYFLDVDNWGKLFFRLQK